MVGINPWKLEICPVLIPDSIQKSLIGVYELIRLLTVSKEYQAEHSLISLGFQSFV